MEKTSKTRSMFPKVFDALDKVFTSRGNYDTSKLLLMTMGCVTWRGSSVETKSVLLGIQVLSSLLFSMTHKESSERQLLARGAIMSAGIWQVLGNVWLSMPVIIYLTAAIIATRIINGAAEEEIAKSKRKDGVSVGT